MEQLIEEQLTAAQGCIADTIPRRWRNIRWTDENIEMALRTLIGDSPLWPTTAEFRDAGLASLQVTLERTGETERWLQRFGVQRVPDRGTSRWSDEVIEMELTLLIGDSRYWPSSSEFEKAGLSGLNQRLKITDRRDHWVAHFGVELRRPGGGGRSPEERAESRAEREAELEKRLRSFLFPDGSGPDWMPGLRHFTEAGQKRLYDQVNHYGGPEYWARRLGLLYRWNEESVEHELREFCAGRKDFPRQAEFVAAKKEGLLQAIKNRGGVDHWAGRVGVPREVGFSRGVKKVRFDATEARRSLETVCRGRDTFPSSGELTDMLGVAFVGRLRRHGGLDHWAAEMGLPRASRRGRARA